MKIKKLLAAITAITSISLLSVPVSAYTQEQLDERIQYYIDYWNGDAPINDKGEYLNSSIHVIEVGWGDINGDNVDDLYLLLDDAYPDETYMAEFYDGVTLKKIGVVYLPEKTVNAVGVKRAINVYKNSDGNVYLSVNKDDTEEDDSPESIYDISNNLSVVKNPEISSENMSAVDVNISDGIKVTDNNTQQVVQNVSTGGNFNITDTEDNTIPQIPQSNNQSQSATPKITINSTEVSGNTIVINATISYSVKDKTLTLDRSINYANYETINTFTSIGADISFKDTLTFQDGEYTVYYRLSDGTNSSETYQVFSLANGTSSSDDSELSIDIKYIDDNMTIGDKLETELLVNAPNGETVKLFYTVNDSDRYYISSFKSNGKEQKVSFSLDSSNFKEGKNEIYFIAKCDSGTEKCKKNITMESNPNKGQLPENSINPVPTPYSSEATQTTATTTEQPAVSNDTSNTTPDNTNSAFTTVNPDESVRSNTNTTGTNQSQQYVQEPGEESSVTAQDKISTGVEEDETTEKGLFFLRLAAIYSLLGAVLLSRK